MADLQSAAINRSATCAHHAPGTFKSPGNNSILQKPHSAHTNLPERPPALGACTSVGLPQRTDSAFPLSHRTPNLPAAQCPNLASKWSWRRDLNPRPSDYKSDALPAELRQPDHYETLPGNTGYPRTHSCSAHNTAQFLRLAHRKHPGKPAYPQSIAGTYDCQRRREIGQFSTFFRGERGEVTLVRL